MAEKRVKLFSNSFMAGAFALTNFVLVILLMWTVQTEYAPEWKKYQREYYELFAAREEDPELKQRILSTPLEIEQTWDPKLDIIDRCMTCHKGVANPAMADVPQPHTVHPAFKGIFKITNRSLEALRKEGVPDDVLENLKGMKNQPAMEEKAFLDTLGTAVGEEPTAPHKSLILEHAAFDAFQQHNVATMGCVVCHEGQGFATTTHAAHVMHDLDERFGPYDAQHAGWERPLLPLDYVQASCHKCHNVMAAPIPGAAHLNAGWQLVQEKGCKTCHYIVDSGAKQAPELSYVGTKFFNEQGHSDAFHDLRFGYLKESLRCPQANVPDSGAKACEAEYVPPAPAAASANLSGEELVQRYQCITCHRLQTSEKMVGPSLYDIGKRQETAYIRKSILEPDKVVVEGFPKGVMKGTLAGFGFYNDVEANPGIVESLVTYLASLQGGEAGAEGAPAEGAQQEQAATAAVVMPNFNFNDDELRNVVTFLLALQEPTVLWPQKLFTKESEANGQPASGGVAYAGKSGQEVFQLGGCIACHKLDGPERLVGPSLWDIGARQDTDYIRESILKPDKVMVAGNPEYPKGLMKATLMGNGFYQQVSIETLEKLVEYLASLKGKS